jgi:hypothetical protein
MITTPSFLCGEDILVITAGFWDAAKRIRHKMPMQWAQTGCRVLWIEQCPFQGDLSMKGALMRSITGELREVEPRLFVGAMPPALPSMYKSGWVGDGLKAAQRPFYLRRMFQYIRELDFNPKIVVLFQQAARRDIFRLFPNAIRVYYHHDVYGFGHANDAQQRALVACCKEADMVWCVAKEHQDEIIQYNLNTYYLPHAVDERWYFDNRERIPPEYRRIPAPRLVYTGVFQEKIDVQLLIDIARARPLWQLVLVGPVQPKNLDKALIDTLESLPNVHFLGIKDNDDLPGYIDGATVLMLPYIGNANMKSAGLSLKFYEYLISKKPILVTPFTTMQVSADLYYLATGADEWAFTLDQLENGDDPDRAAFRQIEAKKNSYQARLESQRELLASFASRRRYSF